MILSKQAILKEHKEGKIIYKSPKGFVIEDFCKNQSVDVHIGEWVYVPKTSKWVRLFYDEQVILKGTFFLAYTEEFIGTAPSSNIHPQWHLRSTLARQGLMHPKAGWGDVGFYNRWCMEFYALEDIIIKPFDRVAQISFEYTTDSEDYTKETGNYQSNVNIDELMRNWKKEDILPKDNNK
jgi:deoxycytidine triphosphate deaminase